MIWPKADRLPHSLLFKRMQIKRIADNIRAFPFLLTNWNKKPNEERIYRWTEFLTSWTIRSEKCARAHVQQNKTIYLSIYLSIWKTFWKRVYIFMCPLLTLECSFQAMQTKGKVFYFFYKTTSPRGEQNSFFREKKFLPVRKSCTQSLSVWSDLVMQKRCYSKYGFVSLRNKCRSGSNKIGNGQTNLSLIPCL